MHHINCKGEEEECAPSWKKKGKWTSWLIDRCIDWLVNINQSPRATQLRGLSSLVRCGCADVRPLRYALRLAYATAEASFFARFDQSSQPQRSLSPLVNETNKTLLKPFNLILNTLSLFLSFFLSFIHSFLHLLSKLNKSNWISRKSLRRRSVESSPVCTLTATSFIAAGREEEPTLAQYRCFLRLSQTNMHASHSSVSAHSVILHP